MSTAWVANFPFDPETGVGTEEVFVVVALETPIVVDAIRINGYATSLTYQNNSTRSFQIAINDVTGGIVTALNAEVPLQPGYHTYQFLPVELIEVGFVFTGNYGGGQLEVADIQVCAAG